MAKEDRTEMLINAGMVTGVERPFIIDSGASICMVPETLVNEEQYVGEAVCIRDANGGKESRRVAIIDIEFQSYAWKRRVAVAPVEDVSDGALLAINLSNPKHASLVAEYQQCKRQQVFAVQTRQEEAAESEQVQKEQEFLREIASPTQEVMLESVCLPPEKVVCEGDGKNMSEDIAGVTPGVTVVEVDENALGIEKDSLDVGVEVIEKEVLDKSNGDKVVEEGQVGMDDLGLPPIKVDS